MLRVSIISTALVTALVAIPAIRASQPVSGDTEPMTHVEPSNGDDLESLDYRYSGHLPWEISGDGNNHGYDFVRHWGTARDANSDAMEMRDSTARASISEEDANLGKRSFNWGFGLNVDSPLRKTWKFWATVLGSLKVEETDHLCKLDKDSVAFEIAVDQLAGKLQKPKPVGVASSDDAGELAGIVGSLSEPDSSATAPGSETDLEEKVIFGDRSRPVPAKPATEEEIHDVMAGPKNSAEITGTDSAAEITDSSSMLSVSSSTSDAYDDLPAGDGSFRHGMHHHTAAHALRRLKMDMAKLQSDIAGDVLFEGYEHESTYPEKHNLFGLKDANRGGGIELDNGVTVTYPQVIALAGDFYGDPECPISTGPVDTDSELVATFKKEVDGREQLVEKVYENCKWEYAERRTSRTERCPTEAYGGVPAVQRRFLNAFATLNHGDSKELKGILKIFEEEHRRIRSPKTAVVDYLDIGNDLNFKYGKITGAELMSMPRPFGVAPVGGRFMDLAGVNWDHFGLGGWNKDAYLAGHREAIKLAARAHGTGDKKKLGLAYAMNSFADHFLTDQFSTGHYRNFRRKLHECCTISSVGGNLPWGDLLAKYQHDEGNFEGLYMKSRAEKTPWKAYGDKFWFAPKNKANRARAQRAVIASIQEVSDAFRTGEIKETKMTDYFPEETNKEKNFRPLFKLIDGDLAIREPMNDAYHPSPVYTKNFVGMSSFFKLRHIAWEREYWYKYHNMAPPVPSVDASRYFGAHDGTGSDEGVMLELLALRTNKQVKEMKAEYKRLYPQRSILKDTLADTSGELQKILKKLLQANKKEGIMKNSEAMKYARMLYNAGEDRWGTDEDVFVNVLAGNYISRNKAIADAYREISDMTLRDAIDSEFSGDAKDYILLLVPKEQFSGYSWDISAASRVHQAMEGLGTDENKIAKVLRRYNNKALKKVSKAFERKYHKSIISEIESDTSSNTEACLVALASPNKREKPFTTSEATSVARAIYKAGEDKWGTDETAFVKHLCKNSNQNVRMISKAYRKISKHSLKWAIEDETSGDLENTLLGAIGVTD